MDRRLGAHSAPSRHRLGPTETVETPFLGGVRTAYTRASSRQERHLAELAFQSSDLLFRRPPPISSRIASKHVSASGESSRFHEQSSSTWSGGAFWTVAEKV